MATRLYFAFAMPPQEGFRFRRWGRHRSSHVGLRDAVQLTFMALSENAIVDCDVENLCFGADVATSMLLAIQGLVWVHVEDDFLRHSWC